MSIYRTIKETYDGNKKKNFDSEFLPYKFIYRPLSFPLTVVCIRAGLSANMVTLINLFVFIVSASCFLFGGYALSVIGAVLFFCFYILDFVDGNIARYHGATNYFGKFIDGLLDTVGFFILIFVALNSINSGKSLLTGYYELYIAIISVYFVLYIQYFNMRLAFLSLEKVGNKVGDDQKNIAPKIIISSNLVKITNIIYKNSIVLMPVALFFTTVFLLNTILIVYYFIIHVIFGGGYLFVSLLRSRKILKGYREH